MVFQTLNAEPLTPYLSPKPERGLGYAKLGGCGLAAVDDIGVDGEVRIHLSQGFKV